jgi:hypothetical protein
VARIPYLKELYTPNPVQQRSGLMTLLQVPVLPVWFVAIMVVTVLFAVVAFALGYHARTLHVIILLLLVYLLGFDHWGARPFGDIAMLEWVYLFFMPYDRLWGEDGQVIRAPLWGKYLVWAQITIVYLCTFQGKAMAEGGPWYTGDALFNGLHSVVYGRIFVSEWVPFSHPVARVVGLIVLAAELAIPIAFWHRRTRPFAIVGLFVLHVGALTTTRVSALFQLLMFGQAGVFLSSAGWERIFKFMGWSGPNGKRWDSET